MTEKGRGKDFEDEKGNRWEKWQLASTKDLSNQTSKDYPKDRSTPTQSSCMIKWKVTKTNNNTVKPDYFVYKQEQTPPTSSTESEKPLVFPKFKKTAPLSPIVELTEEEEGYTSAKNIIGERHVNANNMNVSSTFLLPKQKKRKSMGRSKNIYSQRDYRSSSEDFERLRIQKRRKSSSDMPSNRKGYSFCDKRRKNSKENVDEDRKGSTRFGIKRRNTITNNSYSNTIQYTHHTQNTPISNNNATPFFSSNNDSSSSIHNSSFSHNSSFPFSSNNSSSTFSSNNHLSSSLLSSDTNQTSFSSSNSLAGFTSNNPPPSHPFNDNSTGFSHNNSAPFSPNNLTSSFSSNKNSSSTFSPNSSSSPFSSNNSSSPFSSNNSLSSVDQSNVEFTFNPAVNMSPSLSIASIASLSLSSTEHSQSNPQFIPPTTSYSFNSSPMNFSQLPNQHSSSLPNTYPFTSHRRSAFTEVKKNQNSEDTKKKMDISQVLNQQ
eukprot:TRINITY_DN11226_c0_g1_i1.p1 TRINITY_DN11226_c0_g1~~TRINITY_DN11226_c0_g1_i1.p1  ORF type:complete len:488 (-),score=67.08 TRINITY_DN11226_c0_g1_i1:39-1502(-)